MRTTILVIVSLAATSPHAFGWGKEGHRVIASLAQSRMSDLAYERLRELIGDQPLWSLANWPDDVRGVRQETSGWHYVDIPRDAAGFEDARDCTVKPNETDHQNCVVDRIVFFQKILADRNSPKDQRVEALKFLVHFTGDVHQPLHAIGDEKGGNGILVKFFDNPQCPYNGKEGPCNLHAIWDSGLIDHRDLTEEEYVNLLKHFIIENRLEGHVIGDPALWANESHELAKKVWVENGTNIGSAYYSQYIGVINERLALAGIRLADLLNKSLGK